MFDDPNSLEYNFIRPSVIESSVHKELALQAARYIIPFHDGAFRDIIVKLLFTHGFSFATNRESIVLLKNEQKLPISPHAQGIKTIALVGPNANASDILLGNYHGDPSQIVSILDAMQQLFEGTRKPFPSLYLWIALLNIAWVFYSLCTQLAMSITSKDARTSGAQTKIFL